MPSLREIAKFAGMSHVAVRKRLNNGWGWDEANHAWIAPGGVSQRLGAKDDTIGTINPVAPCPQAVPHRPTIDETRKRVADWSRMHRGQRPDLDQIGIR